MVKVFVQTYGCSFNQADSEAIAGVLTKEGHTLVSNADSADAVVVNSCVVKNKTQKELFKFLNDMKSQNKKIVVAGCAPSSIPEKLEGLSMINVDSIHKVGSVVERTVAGDLVLELDRKPEKHMSLPRIRKNPLVEIIPISKGCLGSCTYCLTVEARGKLDSYEGRDIKHQAEQAIKEGVKELWLTSQDTACWGMDIKQRLPQLVDSLTHIEGNFFIRIGMGNPNWFVHIVDDLIPVLKHDKVFKFLHIPVQAGDDRILKEMKRGYPAKAFKTIVDKLRKEIPNITIATDIICGFPGETEDEFKKTLELLEETRPQVVNISRFAARPKTKAALMENQIEGDILKQRSQRVTEVFHRISREELKKWVGTKTTILIDEPGKQSNQWVGRTPEYLPVVVGGSFKLGDLLSVEITDSDLYHLKGRVS